MVELAGLRVVNLSLELLTILLVVVHCTDVILLGDDTTTYSVHRACRIYEVCNIVNILYQARVVYVVGIPSLVEWSPSYD